MFEVLGILEGVDRSCCPLHGCQGEDNPDLVGDLNYHNRIVFFDTGLFGKMSVVHSLLPRRPLQLKKMKFGLGPGAGWVKSDLEHTSVWRPQWLLQMMHQKWNCMTGL